MAAAADGLERMLATAPHKPSDEELAEATAALAARGATDHHSREFLYTLLRLTETVTQLGRADTAFEWLLDVDDDVAASTDPVQRHNLSLSLGQTLLQLGRHREARERLAAAYPIFVERFPADHGNVHLVRRYLVQAMVGERDYATALPLQELVVATQRRTGTENLELLEDLRQLGDIHGRLGHRQPAYDLLEECLGIARRLWPADHIEVSNALEDFASAHTAMGDYRGSYELLREVLAIRRKTLPANHPTVLWLQQSLSQLLFQSGDLQGARNLQAQVLEVLEQSPGRDEAMLLTSLQHHARLQYASGDPAGARETIVKVIAKLEGTVAEHDRDLNTARDLLGCIERRRGAIAESRALLETAFAGLAKTLPLDHNSTQIACADLIVTCQLQGDLARCVHLADLLLDASTASIRTTLLAARPTARLAVLQDKGIAQALSLALDDTGGAATHSLVVKSLLVSQLLQGGSGQVARAAQRRRQAHTDELSRLAAELAATPNDAANEHLAAQVREKERLERESLRQPAAAPAASSPLTQPTIEALAGALPPHSAAIATVRFTRRMLAPDDPLGMKALPWLVGIVLLPGGEVKLVDLGDSVTLRARIDAMDASTYKQIRSVVLDPLRDAAPDAKVLYLALDDILQLVPWDALPLASGARVGSAVELRRLSSLLELQAERVPPPTAPARMVAVGGVDYRRRGGNDAPAVAAAATAPESPLHDLLRGGGEFVPLQGSLLEVQDIGASFQAAFPGSAVTVLQGDGATKAALAEALPGATFVHFATHGFVAYDRIKATTPSVGGGKLPAVDFDLAPFSLCGLALSGANLGPDAAGRSPGLLTAEELQHYELGGCHLATLSACESAMGAWSRGQGFASLHEALHIAGVRYVVSTLWPVSDKAAQHVMSAFYRALWRAPDQPYRALWQAKQAAAAEGLSFHEWAPFQLSGM